MSAHEVEGSAAAGVVVVLTACHTAEEAEGLGRALVEARLAACGTALPGAVSHYYWAGRLERGEECLLLLKTTRARLAELERRLLQLHSYDCPEFVVLAAVGVSEGYAAWVRDSVAAP